MIPAGHLAPGDGDSKRNRVRMRERGDAGSCLADHKSKGRVTCTRSVLGNELDGYIYVTMASPSQNAIQISHFCSSSTSALWLTH